MKVGIAIMILGIIIIVSGTIFHLQGQGIIGPESSFMYSNPDWISYGLQIVVVGIVIVGIGIAVIIKKS